MAKLVASICWRVGLEVVALVGRVLVVSTFGSAVHDDPLALPGYPTLATSFSFWPSSHS